MSEIRGPRRITHIPEATKPTTPLRSRWIIAGLGVYAFTAYGVYAYMKLSRMSLAAQTLNVPKDVSDRYDKTAKNFDNEVSFTEAIMGLGWSRQSLARKAHGNVLEVSVGTGRNSTYYDLKKCKSITMVDKSPQMIEIARTKFEKARPKYKSFQLLTQSALDPIPSPDGARFDTIVQTMGLCSTPEPSALLRHLGQIVDPSDGQILLLEHGRGHYAWLNRILDATAPAYADKHGCWWNRDIGKIVADSGLEVVEMKRHHFGTTWWVILRPKKRFVLVPRV